MDGHTLVHHYQIHTLYWSSFLVLYIPWELKKELFVEMYVIYGISSLPLVYLI